MRTNNVKTKIHTRIITMRYLGATNYLGVRLKIIDHRFSKEITLARDYEFDAIEQALKFFDSIGIEIDNFGGLTNGDTVFCSHDFSIQIDGKETV